MLFISSLSQAKIVRTGPRTRFARMAGANTISCNFQCNFYVAHIAIRIQHGCTLKWALLFLGHSSRHLCAAIRVLCGTALASALSLKKSRISGVVRRMQSPSLYLSCPPHFRLPYGFLVYKKVHSHLWPHACIQYMRTAANAKLCAIIVLKAAKLQEWGRQMAQSQYTIQVRALRFRCI